MLLRKRSTVSSPNTSLNKLPAPVLIPSVIEPLILLLRLPKIIVPKCLISLPIVLENSFSTGPKNSLNVFTAGRKKLSFAPDHILDHKAFPSVFKLSRKPFLDALS